MSFERIRAEGLPSHIPLKEYVHNLGDGQITRRQLQPFRDELARKPPRQAREPKGKAGMEELKTLLLSLKKDIKYIRGTDSLEGANRWIAKHGPTKFHASNDDVNNDGIPDTIIYDSAQHPVVIDGYTTVQSDFLGRNKYYSDVAPVEYQDVGGRTRTKMPIPYKNYLKEHLYSGVYHDNGLYEFSPEATETINAFKNKGYKVKKPRNLSPYQLFNSRIITPILNSLQRFIKSSDPHKSISAGIRSKVLSSLWSHVIIHQVLVALYGPEVDNLTKVEFTKLMATKPVKEHIFGATQAFITNLDNDRSSQLIEACVNELLTVDTDPGYAELYEQALLEVNPAINARIVDELNQSLA
jgi:hypothetical protein